MRPLKDILAVLGGDLGKSVGLPQVKNQLSRFKNTKQTTGTKQALKDLLRTFQTHLSGDLIAPQAQELLNSNRAVSTVNNKLLQNAKAFDKQWRIYTDNVYNRRAQEGLGTISAERAALQGQINAAEQAQTKAKALLDDFKHKHNLAKGYLYTGVGATGLAGAGLVAKSLEKEAGLKEFFSNLYKKTQPPPKKTPAPVSTPDTVKLPANTSANTARKQ